METVIAILSYLLILYSPFLVNDSSEILLLSYITETNYIPQNQFVEYFDSRSVTVSLQYRDINDPILSTTQLMVSDDNWYIILDIIAKTRQLLSHAFLSGHCLSLF